MNAIAIAPWAVLAVTLLGLLIAATKPGFAARVVVAAFELALPSILKAMKPASPEELKRQKARTDRGQESGAVGNGPINRWGRGKGE